MGVLTIIGAVIGALCLLGSFFVGGAPQQAALAAMACAFAIIPYVMFRVGQAADDARQKKVFFEQMSKRMEELIEATSKKD